MTPFDDLAIKLILAAPPYSDETDERLALCLTFVKVCVTKYTQMQNSSERHWDRIEKIVSNTLDRENQTRQDWLSEHIEPVEVRVNYFGFVEELNRFGRIFDKDYHVTIPNYQKIKFYRNKMIEHRDDYWEYLHSSKNDGLFWYSGKLVIPYHVGQENLAETRKTIYSELDSEFQKFSGVYPAFDVSMRQDDFAERVFSNLAQIHPEPSQKALENIVNLLFKIGFPVPIHDIEEYCNRLIAWLEDFIATLP